mmetsp:Transcript_15279/g.31492  ORF Transcript_15279/g.31492 Transcript_15279/m.31492 type:complete len:110 (+) Transcript_15279:387-716(+)
MGTDEVQWARAVQRSAFSPCDRAVYENAFEAENQVALADLADHSNLVQHNQEERKMVADGDEPYAESEEEVDLQKKVYCTQGSMDLAPTRMPRKLLTAQGRHLFGFLFD